MTGSLSETNAQGVPLDRCSLAALRVGESDGSWGVNVGCSNSQQGGVTIQIDNAGDLSKVARVDLFLPNPSDSSGSNPMGFTYPIPSPVSLKLRVGQLSTDKWSTSSQQHQIACSRPSGDRWRVQYSTTPADNRDISPESWTVDLTQPTSGAVGFSFVAVDGRGDRITVTASGTSG